MGYWTERNTGNNASTDNYGRRTNSRTFSIFDFPIDNSTTRVISQTPTSPAITKYGDAGGEQLPSIGSVWSDNPAFSPLTLDRYDVQVNGQEILAVAQYSSAHKEVNLEMGWVNQMVPVPFAIKVATGAVTAFAAGADRLVYSWQISSVNVPVSMVRLQVTGRMHVSQIGEVDTLIGNEVNRVRKFKVLAPVVGIPNIGSVRHWKFEGAQASEIGPDYVQIRYSFVGDPGTESILWPLAFGAGTPESRYAVPGKLANVFDMAGVTWTRPPFHEIRVIPPHYANYSEFTPGQPKPPIFAAISTVSNTDDPVEGGFNLPGVGPFPIIVRPPPIP